MRHLEGSNSQRHNVEWCLPEVRGVGSCWLMRTDFLLCKKKRVLEVGCKTMWISLTPLNCLLKNGQDATWVLSQLKNDEEFQDGNSRTLNQVSGASKPQALCNYMVAYLHKHGQYRILTDTDHFQESFLLFFLQYISYLLLSAFNFLFMVLHFNNEERVRQLYVLFT